MGPKFNDHSANNQLPILVAPYNKVANQNKISKTMARGIHLMHNNTKACTAINFFVSVFNLYKQSPSVRVLVPVSFLLFVLLFAFAFKRKFDFQFPHQLIRFRTHTYAVCTLNSKKQRQVCASIDRSRMREAI